MLEVEELEGLETVESEETGTEEKAESEEKWEMMSLVRRTGSEYYNSDSHDAMN